MFSHIDEFENHKTHIDELTTQVMAAELHLTYFAARQGRDSKLYQDSLRDFGTAWYLLKKNRGNEAFLKEVRAS